MRLLKLPSYTYPEQESSFHLATDLEDAMVDAGIQIVMYVPTPTRGVSDEVRKEYKKKKLEFRNDGKIEVHRFNMFREPKNILVRALRYVLVNICQYIKGTQAKDIDVIYSGSTPPTQGLLCALVKKKLSKKYMKKVKLVYAIQDMFPESLVSTGICSEKSIIYKIGTKVSDYAYNNADAIITISETMRTTLIKKGVPANKVTVIHNWIDTDEVKPIERKDNALFDELSLDREKFYITYAGNLGYAQSIDTILAAAEMLKDKKSIILVIFGTGTLFNEYSKKIVSNFDNVLIFPILPPERISEVYSLGDASVVSCKKGVGKGSLPSKTWSILATRTPVLLSFDKDGELKSIFEDNKVGLFSPTEESEKLADNIMRLFNDRQLKDTLGANARKLAVERFSKKRSTEQYVSIIQDKRL